MAEDYQDPIRSKIEELILDEAEHLVMLPVGSDERKRSTDCIVALHGSLIKDYNAATQIMKDQAEVELNERKFLEEARRLDRETEAKEIMARASSKWYNQEITKTVIVAGTSLASIGLCMVINAGDMPFRSALERYLILLKPKA